MKKNILLAIVALMTSVCTFAQKEYNMVITLNNGTTVTLGHNDIKEITFNDGNVSISGNMINTIDSLAGVTTTLDQKIMNVATATDDVINKLVAAINEKNAHYDSVLTNIASLMESQSNLNEQILAIIEEQNTVNENFSQSLEMIMYFMEQLHPELAGAPERAKIKAALENARKSSNKALETARKASIKK